MNKKGRTLVAVLALFVSLAFGYITFADVKPGQDLYAYALAFGGLIFSCTSLFSIYPFRKNFYIRLLCVLAIVLVLFSALEFLGGIAWYLLDKIVRHHPKP
jgi:hypothetical protein